MLNARTCIPYIAIAKLVKKYRDSVLKPLVDAVETIVPEECREYEHLVSDDSWELAERLVYGGDVAKLLEEEGVNMDVVKRYAEDFTCSHREFESCGGVPKDHALYLAVWSPALHDRNDRRFALLASLLVGIVQSVWISVSRELAVIILEFMNKAEALSHTRIPHDVLIVSSTLSALIAYATAKLASAKLSPFLVVRPPPALNPFYYGPIVHPEQIPSKQPIAEPESKVHLDSKLAKILNKYAVGIYPAISVVLVPVNEGSTAISIDVDDIAKTLIENVREGWRIIVDHVRNELLPNVKWNARCLLCEKRDRIEKLLEKAAEKPPYQYALSVTHFSRTELQEHLRRAYEEGVEGGVWRFVVDTYTEGHEGVSMNKYVWAPLYNVNDLDPNRVARVNKLCTNCYQLISVVEAKEEAQERGRYPPCIAGTLVLRGREKLCIYCLINRLLINPFNTLFNVVLRGK